MSTEIYDNFPGRSFSDYGLLNEIMEAHGLDRRDAHDSIHALLEQLVEIDGEDAVIVSRRPVRPELLESNPSDLDIRYWVTISEEAAQTIRDQFAAQHANEDEEQYS